MNKDSQVSDTKFEMWWKTQPTQDNVDGIDLKQVSRVAYLAALAQPQAAQPAPLSDAEVLHIARTTPMGGSNRERDANLIRAGFDVGVGAAQPAPQAEPTAAPHAREPKP